MGEMVNIVIVCGGDKIVYKHLKNSNKTSG